MKRIVGTCGLIALAAMTTGCGFNIFEDIGTDPHPPTVEIIKIVLYDEATANSTVATDASLLRGKSIAWNSGGFTLDAGQKFQIERSYTDAGGDIVKFHLRDRDGAKAEDLTPTDQTYFSGTSGTIPSRTLNEDGTPVVPAEIIELTGMFGQHRMEFWAEDSHGSRSEKVEFVITLAVY